MDADRCSSIRPCGGSSVVSVSAMTMLSGWIATAMMILVKPTEPPTRRYNHSTGRRLEPKMRHNHTIYHHHHHHHPQNTVRAAPSTLLLFVRSRFLVNLLGLYRRPRLKFVNEVGRNVNVFVYVVLSLPLWLLLVLVPHSSVPKGCSTSVLPQVV